MSYGRASLSWLLVLAVLLSATAASSSTDPNDVWAGLSESSRKVASFLTQSDLNSLSLTRKSMRPMLSLAHSLKPRSLSGLTGTAAMFPFCKTLDLSYPFSLWRFGVGPNLLEVLSPHRFPSLVSLDLPGNYLGLDLPERPVQPLPVLASVSTLRVSQYFKRFSLLPEMFPNLQSLTFSGQGSVNRFVDWSFLAQVQNLKEFDAVDLNDALAAALPPSLTVLRVYRVRAPFRLPHLQELIVGDGGWRLPDFSTLEASSRSLKKLRISNAQNILDLQRLRLLAGSLEELRFLGFNLTDEMLEQLEVISSLTNLRTLMLSACLGPSLSTRPLDALRVFGSNLLALEHLELIGFPTVSNMQNFLNSVPLLISLGLYDTLLQDHHSLVVSHLGNLEILNLDPELTNLHLWDTTLNTGATRLHTLWAENTQAIHGLQYLPPLRHLNKAF